MLAFATLMIVVVTVFVVGDPPSAGACSCVTSQPVMSTFVGRVASAHGDAFSFVDVVTKSGDPVSNPVVVNILAGRKPDAKGMRMITSCDVAGNQPLVGGVYQVTVDPIRPHIGSCGGSFSLVAAPAVETTNVAEAPESSESESESSSRPTVALAVGGVLLVIAAGMAIQGRKQRDD